MAVVPRTLTGRLRLLLGGLVLLTALVVAAVLPSTLLIRDAQTRLEDRWLPATQSVRELLAGLVDQETGERGYLITGQESFLAPYDRGYRATRRHLARLRTLLPEEQRAGLARLDRAYRSWRTEAEHEIMLVRSGRAAEARGEVLTGTAKRRFDRVRTEALDLQRRVDAELNDAEHRVSFAYNTLLGAIALGAVGAIAFGFLARRLLRNWAARVDEQERAVRQLGEATRLVDALAQQSPDPIFLKGATGDYRFVNTAAARAIADRPADEVVGRTDRELVRTDTDLDAMHRHDAVVLERGEPVDFEENVGGRRFLVTKSPHVFADGSVGVLGVARDITERVRNESRTAAFGSLARALATEAAPRDVARAAVAPLRDATGADLVWIMEAVESGRALEALVDDGTRATTADTYGRLPVNAPTATTRTFLDGEFRVQHRADAEPATAAAAVFAAEDLEVVCHLPLVAGGHPIGVLNLGWRAPHRISDPDAVFLGDLAALLAEALARAIATEQQRAAVETFQRVLVPHEPFASSLDVAARYEPALNAVAMGGDWYDVFDIDADRLGLAVGDVVGSGVHAAAVMGRMRSALRALALVMEEPGAVLDRLDQFAADVRGAMSTTALFGVYDRRDGTLRYSVAGHVPPLLLHAGGVRMLTDAGSPPLGIGLEAPPRPTATVRLVPGDLVIAYTDGLVERRDEPVDAGIVRLGEQAAAVAAQPIEELTDAVLAGLTRRERHDDTVLLCARVPDPAAPYFSIRIQADPRRIRVVRHALGDWLRARGVADDVVSDAQIAVTEAATNAIEHGAELDDQQTVAISVVLGPDLTVSVRDHGSWRTELRRPDRGRGLEIMRSVMDDVRVVTSEHGTVITMRRGVDRSSGAGVR